ncbi:MAG: geranyl transferase [Desulfobacterales bacterium]|nr:MAG: geranyl transferase [Desulfobacterales bacterium]
MDLKKLVRVEAERIDRLIREDISEIVAVCDPLLVEILEYALLGGGKRIRPLLTIMGGRIGGRNDRNLYRLAAAFEYLHVATLLHDDVIDQSETRRGKTSVFKKFGVVGAILAGDYLHAFSMRIVGMIGGEPGLSRFTEATRGMVDGEFIQLRNRLHYNQSEEDYFSVIMGKTALLISAACEVGGIYSGLSPDCLKALKTYGLKLGCAFQIVDDLLDYQGDTVKTGKETGNDLVEGKMTLPLIYAMQRADKKDSARLLAIMKEEQTRGQFFQEVVTLITRYDGFDQARHQAQMMVRDAVAVLEPLAHKENRASIEFLQVLAEYILQRQR